MVLGQVRVWLLETWSPLPGASWRAVPRGKRGRVYPYPRCYGLGRSRSPAALCGLVPRTGGPTVYQAPSQMGDTVQPGCTGAAVADGTAWFDAMRCDAMYV